MLPLAVLRSSADNKLKGQRSKKYNGGKYTPYCFYFKIFQDLFEKMNM